MSKLVTEGHSETLGLETGTLKVEGEVARSSRSIPPFGMYYFTKTVFSTLWHYNWYLALV